MSRIRSKDTKPEMVVRKFLFSKGFRYLLNVKNLPGKPDIVLARYKTAIFVQGCFWHGHENCKYYRIPETRKKWWIEKINQTKKNDENNELLLKAAGWEVIVIWECELKKDKKDKTLLGLLQKIKCQ
jgi:DNA mismatch endonuclease (patch repair protein)